ncbi:hypothetical protein EI991_05570 [Streptococcus suis]|nr:hypothetical protein EI991_05570 [Streptococcus suis]
MSTLGNQKAPNVPSVEGFLLERDRTKEFVNKSLFSVVELKRSIPRPFQSHPRIAPKVRGTFGGWR